MDKNCYLKIQELLWFSEREPNLALHFSTLGKLIFLILLMILLMIMKILKINLKKTIQIFLTILMETINFIEKKNTDKILKSLIYLKKKTILKTCFFKFFS